ncbi:hypothetical protein AB0L97_32915 [Nocardia sp. NPDC051911]
MAHTADITVNAIVLTEDRAREIVSEAVAEGIRRALDERDDKD